MDVEEVNRSPPPDSAHDVQDPDCSLVSQASPFSLLLKLNGHLPRPTPDAGLDGLVDDSSLPKLHIATPRLQEHIGISKASIELLAAALEHERPGTREHEKCPPLTRYEARKRRDKLKLELPLLSHDPDDDLCQLARAIQEQRQPNISSFIFPPERLSKAADESLEFPDAARKFRDTMWDSVQQEKLDVPKLALYQLAQSLRDDWHEEENREVLQRELVCRHKRPDLAITPPLSPYVQHDKYYVPDVKVCEIPMAADLISLLSDDLTAAEAALRNESSNDELSQTSNITTPRLSPLSERPILGAERHKIDSVKIESPLLPFSLPDGTSERGVNMLALRDSMDMDHTLSHPSSSETGAVKSTNVDDILDKAFHIAIEESSIAVTRSIEQECINVASAMARIEVPIVDFSLPEPEWQALPMTVEAHVDWIHTIHGTIPAWPRNSRADSQLRWVPFLQRIDLQALTSESIDSETDPLQLQDPPNPQKIPISADYVWKRPGLAILDEPESEELEVVAVPPDTVCDLASLARKRRLRAVLDSECPARTFSPPTKRKLRLGSDENSIQLAELLPGEESTSTVSSLLSNYIDIRMAKRQKQDKSPFFSLNTASEVELPPSPIFKKPQLERDSRTGQTNATLEPRASHTINIKATIAPCPKICNPVPPTKLIKGLTLSRSLFARLEELYPTAEIIERDFDRWNTVVSDRHPGSKLPRVSPLASEADILVSPATGIVVTTLLKAIQRPLPGRSGESAIRERIRHLISRYEQLIVLVSEGNLVDETAREFTPSETCGYAEFVSFAAGLGHQIEVFYVGGGEATVATWLVSLIAHHAHEAAEIQEKIMQDETQWELFLRRAGFNAYAAQAVLIRLKAASDQINQRESSWAERGLSALVKMSAGERLKHFRDLMGGEDVLNRVSRMLEARWS
ncbi:hypothetical protein GGS20DRAFT_590315 [Poronia punctata]|nr:hypothetical protein GGS20DRAFT_590315 [Poronia punctata]